MYSFRNDYSEGACHEVMEALIATNDKQSCGYGLDDYCEKARNTIRKLIHCEGAGVHFLVGGTQANLTVISAMLKPYEAVISVQGGHINTHETGSIEAVGHKILIADDVDGKIVAESIEKVVLAHEDEHMVKPAMVYISNATEVGTIYTEKELKKIHEICHKYNLLLFMDGARLGSALSAESNDLTLARIAELCDVFYIGGTKNGALFGEAVVICNKALDEDFRYMIKQKGGMLAKGRLLGIQFDTLLEGNLYFNLAKHANKMAQKMQDKMKMLGIRFVVESPTNQIFPILDNQLIQQLQKKYEFQVWEKVDQTSTAMRFVTSWATPEQVVEEFIQDFEKCMKGESVN